MQINDAGAAVLDRGFDNSPQVLALGDGIAVGAARPCPCGEVRIVAVTTRT